MIHLQEVRKSFPHKIGDTPVLCVSDLQVAEGERVALVGTSGSGKTTLLNLLSGLILPDQGHVKVDGIDVAALSEPKRDRFRAQHIGYVFQSFHLLDGFTALENVELGASFLGKTVDRRLARSLLDSVGLHDRADHLPSELSVGQQSRVALARALINSPKLLLADEPTGSLDPKTGSDVLRLLLDTAMEEGITVVCATHDQSVAGSLDRVVSVEDLS